MLSSLNINEIDSDLIKNELQHISSMLNCEKNLKKQLMIYMEKLSVAISKMVNPASLDDIHKCLENMKDKFDKINNIIQSLKSLITILNELNEDLNNIDKDKIDNYNLLVEQVFSGFIDINDSIYGFLSTLDPYISINFPEEENDLHTVNTESDAIKICQESEKNNTVDEFNSLNENTLIISEKENKVILPYYFSDLQELQKKDSEKDASLEYIIKKYYTISLDNYKNSSFSRFREAFNLVKNKEKGSFKDAVDLGLELFFNNNLNPSIITACRNLDELDIYLSCLDDNELSQFRCFNIVYEYSPTCIVKPK